MDAGGENEEVDFLFDMVITSLDLYKPVAEPEKCDVLVRFAGRSMKITPSRINVRDFVNNRQNEFTCTPSTMREFLSTEGMQISARYGGSSLGTNKFFLPDTFVDKVYSNMNDLLYEDTILLMRRIDCIGSIGFLFVLTVKCLDLEALQEKRRSSSRRTSRKSSIKEIPPKKEEEKAECQRLGPTFNPQDVMFVVGDPDPLLQIPSQPCSELAPEEGDERLDLDLQRYKSRENRRAIFPYDDPCPKEKPSLTKLKQLTHEYSQIIGLVTDKVKRLDGLSSPPEITEPLSKKKSPLRTQKEALDERFIPVPIRDDTENNVKPIRFCPVCLYSMSWLPKYIPCPRCKVKARPVLTGHPKKVLTADEIVKEVLTKPRKPEDSDDNCAITCKRKSGYRSGKKKKKFTTELGVPIPESESDEECPPCRCTCTVGQICAHCRIRKLCADIFESDAKKVPEDDQHIKVPLPNSEEDFCVIPEPIDDRPYLSRVFCELKYLYNLHDTKKLDIQKHCDSQTLLPYRSTKSTIALKHSPDGLDHIPGQFGRLGAGHKSCLPVSNSVPRRHGWNWPSSREARKFGWRPGAIMRAAGEVMRYFLFRKEEAALCKNIMADHEARERDRLPVLNICKKNGVIFVTLNPLASSNIKQNPITFRIVKSDLAVALRQIKRSLKDQGFRKCDCHKSLMLCTCRDAWEKFELNKALRIECQKRIMEPCPEHLVLTDTSVSDLEFDLNVTPPAGTGKSKRKALRNVDNHGTQTGDKNERQIPPKYPVPDSPYWRAFDCAAGDRYMGTAFGSNVETVFEDGVFGYEGGGQHGKAPVRRNPKVWGKRTGAPMPIGTTRDSINPYRFTRTVWKGLPKKIIYQMCTNRKL
ncbi:uncharacterized protein LOC108092204 [Drosophila ficusphila]|uniref:uncharacterized protein LOC108092204 n=1 Tax=Drosophila ficusphila TaxID=30025 RepID=UPI001C8A44BB|nr:uncharacterized protein LOC108092204 [Drosophila ficusphila]